MIIVFVASTSNNKFEWLQFFMGETVENIPLT